MWALRRLEIRLIQCALCFYLSAQLCDSVPQRRTVAAAKNTASGCLHNNTLFADTSIIPSTEPCLLCKCSNKNLVCVRRVCKEQPYPPPRSCILVQKKSLCCPYLSCSKYHINFYKNSERNREHLNGLEGSHEKTLEKSSRTDDSEEANGGCIESGSLYASGSAMVRSSASLCSYCYCLNGHQKCIKPKCLLQDTKCKPIFMDGSCCPVKYDCSFNTTASYPLYPDEKLDSNKAVAIAVKRKNRSNGCFESDKYYQEGEKLPTDVKRPCEMCYCIKGFRKCVIKKCAPLIRGCIPKVPKNGNCCPTSYDCSRSLKVTRQVRQNDDDDEPEEDNDSIDFFSLLFGSDEPAEDENTVKDVVIETTTLQPFKVLPSTEKSFFDLLRAGLEIIDANADKIDSSINNVVTTVKSIPRNVTASEITTESSIITSTEKFTERTTQRTSFVTQSSYKIASPDTTAMQLTTKLSTSPTKSTTISAPKLATTVKTLNTTPAQTSTVKSTAVPENTTRLLKVSSTTLSPSTRAKTTAMSTRKSEHTTKLKTSTKLLPPSSSTTKATAKLRETTTEKVLITTTSSPSTPRTTTLKFMSTTTEGHQGLGAIFNAVISTDVNDSNEEETLPNIIPFLADDAIDTEKFEPYLKPYDNLEKDYFANDKEKPFRYNNRFTHHHSYDDPADYVHSNPHERIDNGPYYFETNDNQFESFSPPSERDFLGGFSPKESIYDEVSTIASELPLKPNEFRQKPLEAPAIHEHKSNVTSTEETLTFPINQTSHKSDDAKQHDVIPDFKKISTNFTSFIDDLLHGNVLEETSTRAATTTTTTTTTTPAPASTTPTAAMKTTQGVMEIFSKPTSPTMNGLLKLAGCNIYGQMYDVGHTIAELSDACLECKCLPDIGVGCTQKC